MLLLLSCWIIAGITAEDQPTRHHRVKNSSLCLQVAKSPTDDNSWWDFNGTRVIVKNSAITPKYADKVDYNPRDHSLCINKLTETDNGIYRFTFFKSDILTTETHRLIVEETVPRPVITMSALHNSSAGLCNVTVNCSIQGDWVSSVCDESSCTTSQRSLRKVNIIIFTDNKSIVCMGNNHVSTSNVSESTGAVCFKKSNPEHEETPEPPNVIVIVIVILIAVFVSLCAFAFCVTKGLFSTEYNCHRAATSTAQIIQSQPVEEQSQSMPRVSSSSSSQAEAFYENMDATQPCQTISSTVSPRAGSASRQSVCSVTNVTSSLGKREDAKGRKTQGALTSQCVTQGESGRPAQIDTVYSVLQRPKNLTSHHHQ